MKRASTPIPQPFRHAFSDSLPGGDYVAIQEADGTWTVTSPDRKGIPIFAKLEAGARENEKTIGREWMLSAIRRHSLLEREQKHLPPVHVNHHQMGRETERIGFLRLTSVGTIPQNGIPTDALFAEIVGVKEEDLERIEDLELPYRSVEVGRWDRPEIASLALLPDEAPFFKMPMLKVTRRIQKFDKPAGAALAAVGYLENTGAPLILFSFRGQAKEQPMAKKAMTPKTIAAKGKKFGNADAGKEDELKKPADLLGDDSPDSDASQLEDIDAGAVEDVSQLCEGGADDGDAGDDDSFDKVEAAFSTVKRFYGLAKKYASTKGKKFQQEGEPGQGEPGQRRDNAPAESAGAKASEDPAIQLAQMQGRLSAMEANLKKQDASSKLSNLVETAVAALQEEGWDVSKQVRATMRKLAGTSTSPKETLQAYCDSFKATAVKDPVRFSEFASRAGAQASDPPEVLKFSAGGPEALEAARSYSSQYDQLKAQAFPLTVSREEFIESNICADAANTLRRAGEKTA